jgi:signal transduction histidine kinase
VGYYPLIQLFIVSLFILITLSLISTSNKSTQNQVWAGMAKEAAHQLGTPISSLEGWVEMLKDETPNGKIIKEIGKDVDRLKLVTDRFGKIGSIPKLDQTPLMPQLEHMVDYIKKRSSDKVQFIIGTSPTPNLTIPMNIPLFDWVIENLLKNALDSMQGKGQIMLNVSEEKNSIKIDVSDTGKGIPKKDWQTVFKPGFTTKKRGWGLGLSLSKRIIEQYHKGQIFVKSSDPQKGTCIRIVLNKA